MGGGDLNDWREQSRAVRAEAEVVRLREALAFATNTPFMNQRTVPYPAE